MRYNFTLDDLEGHWCMDTVINIINILKPFQNISLILVHLNQNITANINTENFQFNM